MTVTEDDGARIAQGLLRITEALETLLAMTINKPNGAEITQGLLRIAEAAEKILDHQFPEVEEETPDNTSPRCTRHNCAYYLHYLTHGSQDMTHDEYHELELQAARGLARLRR